MLYISVKSAKVLQFVIFSFLKKGTWVLESAMEYDGGLVGAAFLAGELWS